MTAEELLKQMSAEPFAEEMVCCVIDPETRVIDVPAEYQLLGVESDEKGYCVPGGDIIFQRNWNEKQIDAILSKRGGKGRESNIS